MPANELKNKLENLQRDLINHENELLKQKDEKEEQSRKGTRQHKRNLDQIKVDRSEAEARKKISELQFEARGYDTFYSALMAMVDIMGLIAKANPLGNALGAIAGGINDKLKGLGLKGFRSPKESFDDWLNPAQVSAPITTAPELFHYVEFGEDNTMSIGDMRRVDGVALTEDSVDKDGNPVLGQKTQIRQILRDGVTLWLDQVDGLGDDNGYKPSPDVAGQYVSKAYPHDVLTKAQFELLRDDPARGFSNFLQDVIEVGDLRLSQHAPSPRPSM